VVEKKEFEQQLVLRTLKIRREYPGPALGSSPFSLFSSIDYNQPSLISQDIVIGSSNHAQDLALLEKLGVTHIMNAAPSVPNYYEDKFIYYNLPIKDDPGFPINKYFTVGSAFLSHVETARGRALVHCIAGVSRSVSLVVAHLIIAHRMTLHDAYKHVRACRTLVQPNNGFKMALGKFS